MPSSCLSLRRWVSNPAKTPSIRESTCQAGQPQRMILSFTQNQRAAQDRCVARKFDVHSLPWLQVLERIRQGPQVGCLDAAENQEPVTRFEPGIFGSGSRLHAANSYAFALMGHVGHDAGGNSAGCGWRRWATRLR